MAALLSVKLITPKEVAYDGTALAVTIPAEAGEMQVYQGHIPVLARLTSGVIRIENPGADPVVFAVDEGFFRITQNQIDFLVDSLQPVS